MATNHNTMFEIRRYVVIVPFQSRALSQSDVLTNSLVNVAVLLVWFAGAGLFTVLRVGMRFAVPAKSVDQNIAERFNNSKTTLFFHYLAGVLGNSAGRVNSIWKGELFLMFVIGIFATLTSMLFTSALFEQLIGLDPPKQMNSLAELIASNLSIMICAGDVYILAGYGFIN